MVLSSPLGPALLPGRDRALLSGSMMILIIGIVVLGGCGRRGLRDDAARLPEPIGPCFDKQDGPGLIDLERRPIRDRRDPAPQGQAAELVLSYIGAGRDFREPVGPDGYVLRVFPLDGQAAPLNRPADVTIALFETKAQGTGEGAGPLRIWRVSSDALTQYWVRGRLLDGYLFRLDWGRQNVAAGRYVLFVRLDYGTGPDAGAICGEISFEDFERRGDSAAGTCQRENRSGKKEIGQ